MCRTVIYSVGCTMMETCLNSITRIGNRQNTVYTRCNRQFVTQVRFGLSIRLIGVSTRTDHMMIKFNFNRMKYRKKQKRQQYSSKDSITYRMTNHTFSRILHSIIIYLANLNFQCVMIFLIDIDESRVMYKYYIPFLLFILWQIQICKLLSYKLLPYCNIVHSIEALTCPAGWILYTDSGISNSKC